MIIGQPINREIVIGGMASFTVIASGVGLTYQWLLGVPGSAPSPLTDSLQGGISGANESTLVLSPPFTTVMSSTEFFLIVVVSNPVGSVSSNAVSLFIGEPCGGMRLPILHVHTALLLNS